MNFKRQTSNLKTTKNFKIPKILWFVVVIYFVVGSWQFEVRALESTETKIKEAIECHVLTTYPEWIGLDIEIEVKNIDRIAGLLNRFSDKADLEIIKTDRVARSVGNVIFPIRVSEGEAAKKIFVRARVAVLAKVVVAATTIRRRRIIEPDLVKLDLRDIARLPQNYFAKVAAVIGKESKTTIPKGSTIYEWMIKDSPLIRNGDKLMILVKGPSLLVKSRGRALMDGYLGQAIRVRAENSKEILNGILVSPDKVEVILK